MFNSTPVLVSIEIYDQAMDERFTMDFENTNQDNYCSKKYDADGALINTVIREGSYLVQYDASGDVINKADISAMMMNPLEQSNPLYMGAPARTPLWQEKIYLQSDTIRDLNNQINAATYIVSIVVTLLGVRALVALAIEGITRLAEYAINNHIHTLYYQGWKQYGWEYGYYMVRYEIRFYQYSNYTGRLKTVSATQGVH